MARVLAAVGVLLLTSEAKKYSAAQLRQYDKSDCTGNFTVVNGDKLDECTPYLIPRPASILVNQTDDTHYSSYHFDATTDCTGVHRLLETLAIGECEKGLAGDYYLMRVWVDAPK